MTRYEYKVIPAPGSPPKIKGVRSATERYARGLQDAMNEMGAAGWDYVRCDRLTVTATEGLLRKRTTTEETLLVFRRPLGPREEASVPAAPPAFAHTPRAEGAMASASPETAESLAALRGDGDGRAPREAPRAARSAFAARPKGMDALKDEG